MLVYTDMIYILLFVRPVCLSQGRGVLYTVICSFMKVLGFNISTVNLVLSGTIHNLRLIADIESR
jgi:hypothetical protein